ncbi:MAG: L-threonylcarbamoyladenylate synthase [Zymomonas mobilis subsp. pomaceae]|uniref:Threonylcarbamoyl-AMP synthase n=1 Tax=Zymomonas mobilis subsp. pomaceae (strain ATCC 29192 / DSM 22645 / JCM 10191 / CCUG 17912 / NBRC 13757 / NCIMB 11200 / NRRL B-4491 / Barker I) TaxID=579138 RepID=F8EUG7_ZYMMT|nr:L-threonylcarbamoyladenylate synthase [Zymomonas mobilis]AEI37183.1 Sua5/YciO/YrdC/YwlC family protein [Zymomonas mobilis subsp. pomaceae ATCC 29192]MDX5948553.1 L-threonylcarbamoyladenylate synthase [Zymomonas mobilis subsp. pomaceae]GEB89862.1 threonylcarbamoyl-AMP synthase [Zymomonas mobilis subsp. pomaceae]
MNAFSSRLGTVVRPCDEAGIKEAVSLIRSGLPVAVPTETVYGLAADAASNEAVARIYQAKGRPSFNPLIVHVADIEQALSIAAFSEETLKIAQLFWPGPLTMVLPLKKEAPIASIVTAGLKRVAIRMPSHPVMRALILSSRCLLAAPSANKSGAISPTSAQHVKNSLDGRIPLILDGGLTEDGLESTIIAPENDKIHLLRYGPITIEALKKATALPIVETHKENSTSHPIEAPGQLSSHYAPHQPVKLEVEVKQPDEWHIGFGKIEGDDNLSFTGDLVEAAAHLFAALHRAEASGCRQIVIAPIPDHGIGRAINDRLRRAAAPR